MSPTSRPQDSAGVPDSIADTTTGRDPWIRNPNSPLSFFILTFFSTPAQRGDNSLVRDLFVSKLISREKILKKIKLGDHVITYENFDSSIF